MTDFKNLHIGNLIYNRVKERQVEMLRICNFLGCNEKDALQMFKAKSLDTEVLLRWSKLLEYDFFRLYSQHLILYAPPSSQNYNSLIEKSSLPQFRKNIYTKEVIDFILEEIKSGEMTKKEVIEKYKIPKTTLYKWLSKYTRDGSENILKQIHSQN